MRWGSKEKTSHYIQILRPRPLPLAHLYPTLKAHNIDWMEDAEEI